MDYKKKIITLLDKVKTEQTFKQVYKLLEYLYLRRHRMDYKKEAVQMLQEINDDSLLEFFYRFIARVLKNRGY